MKSFEGYLKQTAGDTYLLLAGGGIKPLSDFLNASNFKTINGQSLIGTGDISISGASGNYVLKIGDTMTGPLVITYPVSTYGSSCPLQIIATGSGSYQRALAISDTNMAAGSGVNIIWGKSDSSYNCAHATYHHVADGSTSNYGSLDIHGTGEILNWFGNGNVGIGTTSPAYKLHVNGNIGGYKFHSNASSSTDLSHIPSDSEIALETGNGNGGVSCWVWREQYAPSNWGMFHNNSNNWVYFVGNNAIRFGVPLEGGSVIAAGYGSTSDIKYKLDVKDISNILPIRSFVWKDTLKKSYGFVAQELENLGYNELVEDSALGKTVNYPVALSLFLAKLSNIVEENNNSINSRINMLEKRILDLELENQDLKERLNN